MILFSHQPGHSRLHRINPLARLLLFLSLVIPLGSPIWYSTALIGLLLMTAQWSSGIRLQLSFRNLLFFLILAGLVFWGEQRQRGMEAAALKTTAFLFTFYGGLVFTALTDPMDLGETLYRLTRPIPFFPAGQLMTLVTLTLSFLPLIGEEAQQLRYALKSRCLDRRFSPFRSMLYHSMPLMGSVIRRSDEITRAMYSRCYRSDPTLLTDSLRGQDFLWILLGISILSVHQILNNIA